MSAGRVIPAICRCEWGTIMTEALDATEVLRTRKPRLKPDVRSVPEPNEGT